MQQQEKQSERVYNIILQLNKTGLAYLQHLNFPEAVEYFKKAEKIVNQELIISTSNQKINQIAAVTFNNLACYYKKTKKPKVALNYLQKSLDLQVNKINNWISTGSTHLNICAIYSCLEKHQQALSHAKLSLELLQKRQYQPNDTSGEAISYWNIKMLCYYNQAIQQQHLKLYQHSVTSYKQAKEIAKTTGSANVGLIINCEQAINRIESNLTTLRKRLINIFLKKSQDQQSGHYSFMRRNVRNKSKNQLFINSGKVHAIRQTKIDLRDEKIEESFVLRKNGNFPFLKKNQSEYVKLFTPSTKNRTNTEPSGKIKS